jgi:hypothetical protein
MFSISLVSLIVSDIMIIVGLFLHFLGVVSSPWSVWGPLIWFMLSGVWVSLEVYLPKKKTELAE